MKVPLAQGSPHAQGQWPSVAQAGQQLNTNWSTQCSTRDGGLKR